jgi:tRNA A-37 threonylcarbamoyl transferase component Bud32/membrane-associated phospholipid phosphatase
MDTAPGQAHRVAQDVGGPPLSASRTVPAPPGTRRLRRRRRPTGEPPPLPRHLETTGTGWLVAAVALVVLSLVVFAAGRFGREVPLTVVDDWVLERLAALRRPEVTGVMRVLSGLLGTIWTIKVLGWASLIVLVVFRRFRHLLVAFTSVEVVSLLVLALSAAMRRPRPFGVAMQGHWAGWAMPSRPVAYLTAVLVAMLYSLVPEGRWRQAGKWAATGVVLLLAVACMYLGVDHPSDVLVAAAIGVAIPLLAFRWFVPNQVFPVAYRRGHTAHLDVGGQRGEAIRRALQDQLGLVVEEVKPFGLAGSAGSTPLRITVKGDPPTHLFGKLYARSHLRSDRWYKLGRELLYGRLEDEKPFNTVRRLVQQEDYALHKLHLAGLPTPRPYGFVELTPDWEYLLVTEFFDGAAELGEAEVDQAVIDDGLGIVRKLWDAGLAHRDVKPANLLVRDGHLLLIDVAFVEARPSPWRQAVDLANMMLCLALRSDPRLVYERALRQFSVQEVSEGFAATRGLAMPSQLRHLLRERGRDLHAEFLDLLPERPRPVSIQRWNVRRVGLALLAVLGLVVVLPTATSWSLRTDRVNTSLYVSDLGCTSQEPLWLMAQSVPSAGLVPCVRNLPAGWSLADVRVRDGHARITFDSDRAGKGAVVVELTASCDLSGAVQVTSEQPGARRYLRTERASPRSSATRFHAFGGGCTTERFTAPAASHMQLTNEGSSALGFTTREELGQALNQRSGGRLQLDPGATR